MPFPESGLVPCFFLYGVMGIEAVPDGLRISPHLPKSLSYAEVRYLNFRGRKLQVRVTRTSVCVTNADGGPTFDRKLKLSPGESILVNLP